MAVFSQGKYALAISDRSGMAFPYNEMVREWNGAFVHISEYEPKQPQLEPKPTSADPQALQRARPARTEFPTSGFIVIEKVNSTTGIYENEVIEYTGRSSNQLTGCTRGTSAPYRGVSPESTVASSHSNLAKVFGSYKVASLNTTQVKGTGQPEFSTQFDGINVTLVNTASSTETGGGLQCTIGPINDRA